MNYKEELRKLYTENIENLFMQNINILDFENETVEKEEIFQLLNHSHKDFGVLLKKFYLFLKKTDLKDIQNGFYALFYFNIRYFYETYKFDMLENIKNNLERRLIEIFEKEKIEVSNLYLTYSLWLNFIEWLEHIEMIDEIKYIQGYQNKFKRIKNFVAYIQKYSANTEEELINVLNDYYYFLFYAINLKNTNEFKQVIYLFNIKFEILIFGGMFAEEIRNSGKIFIENNYNILNKTITPNKHKTNNTYIEEKTTVIQKNNNISLLQKKEKIIKINRKIIL